MIRIQQLKLRVGHGEDELLKKAAQTLRLKPFQIKRIKIVKQSVDARKKPEIFFSYVVDVALEQSLSETAVVKKAKNSNISIENEVPYQFPEAGSGQLKYRPVIIGMGPAGLFCGYFLAKYGYRPVLLERGRDVDERTKDVEAFWSCGILDPESNVQFGEGGAGTFSDGKLNTLVKDKYGRNKEVLRIFVENGAPESILYENKPHIGTDVLVNVVKNMRDKIISWGGKVYFQTKAEDFIIENDRLQAVKIRTADKKSELLHCEAAVLAIGHSARDTFECLYSHEVPMEAKSFALGLRVEHPQEMINLSQYGSVMPKGLSAAPYKVTASTQSGRGVYSFCMCPGGYVVNASSEPGRLAINGMSYSGRDGKNANSAIIVSVTPQDYGCEGPLSGVAFQRKLEEKAYKAAEGKIPVQRYGDFSDLAKETGMIPDDFTPENKGLWAYTDVAGILPKELKEAFEEGMSTFGRMIPGFDDKNALLSGIESRTSSPVRIHRDEECQSTIRGLYPCGEGAGYAGGITSAAMDGIKVAEAIRKNFAS